MIDCAPYIYLAQPILLYFSICYRYIKEILEKENAKMRKRAVTKRSQKELYR